MAVVSDTSPINYLIVLGVIEVLPQLFGKILIPCAVHGELQVANAPASVRSWVSQLPDWITVVQPRKVDPIKGLHAGETAAIALALEYQSTGILMDERRGRLAAQEQGLRTLGTLAVLELAAQRGLLHLEDAIDRLRASGFRVQSKLVEVVLARARK